MPGEGIEPSLTVPPQANSQPRVEIFPIDPHVPIRASSLLTPGPLAGIAVGIQAFPVFGWALALVACSVCGLHLSSSSFLVGCTFSWWSTISCSSLSRVA